MRDVTLYLRDIHAAMEAIEMFVEGIDLETFLSDLKTKSAVVKQLEVMGEAAKWVPEHIRQAHPGVNWRSMAGMRDRLIHGYFGIDYGIVWETIERTIPIEKPVVARLIKELESESK